MPGTLEGVTDDRTICQWLPVVAAEIFDCVITTLDPKNQDGTVVIVH